MAGPNRLASTLQEDLLTLLVHSDEHGRTVANLVEPDLFEGDYRVIAERSVDYWQRYGKAPRAHVADLLSDILEAKNDRRGVTFRGIMLEMLRLSEAINAQYAIDRLRSFVRLQRFLQVFQEAVKRLTSQREVALPDVEEMLGAFLKVRDDTTAPGASLNDVDRLLDFVRNTATEFSLGIAELDRRNIGPMRGAVLLFLASTGLGKSWFLIHAAKQALMQRKKVLYISLEISEDELLQRFYQAFFGLPTWAPRDGESYMTRTLEKDANGRLEAIGEEEITPEFVLDADVEEDELETRRALMEGKFKNLVIKRFPTRGLTIAALDAYLDGLESSGFVPDVLELDYIGVMKTDVDNHRISLGRIFEDFRGLCVRRNLAGLTAGQMSRAGATAARASQVHVAEDWSLIGTSDVSISMSATEAEKQFGFARLYIEKARRARDRFGVLITQHYDTGQFVLDSAPLDRAYDRLFDRGAPAEEREAGGEE